MEEERAEQARGDGDIALLEPIPTRDGIEPGTNALERDSSDAVVSLSEVPLLRNSGSGAVIQDSVA